MDIALMPNKKILNGNQPDLDECEYQDEDVVAMVEEPNSSDEATNSVDSDWSMDYPVGAVVRVKTLHISSPILAAKKSFLL